MKHLMTATHSSENKTADAIAPAVRSFSAFCFLPYAYCVSTREAETLLVVQYKNRKSEKASYCCAVGHRQPGRARMVTSSYSGLHW